MVEMCFETGNFIAEVKKRPILWNTKHEDFRDKQKKYDGWLELGASMYPASALTASELRKTAAILMKKWRNVRDNYIKELRRLRGDCRYQKKKPYLFTKALSFLKSAVAEDLTGFLENHEISISNSGKEDGSYDKNLFEDTLLHGEPIVDAEVTIEIPLTPDHEQSDQNSTLDTSNKTARKRLDNTKASLISEGCIYQPDEDQSFFDSILPAVRLFDVDKKLEFRIQVMSLIQNLRKS